MAKAIEDPICYAQVLLEQYGEPVEPPRSGRAGRPAVAFKQWPAGAGYATVNKTYAKGKVSEIRRTLVYGTPGDLKRVGQNSDWRSPAIF